MSNELQQVPAGAAQRKAARRTALVLGLIAGAFYASIFVAQMLRNAA